MPICIALTKPFSTTTLHPLSNQLSANKSTAKIFQFLKKQEQLTRSTVKMDVISEHKLAFASSASVFGAAVVGTSGEAVKTDFWHSITDERVNEYYLLRGGPTLILSIVTLYLYFVLSLGPKMMAKREKFKLNKILLVYNMSMASANLWLFVQGLKVSNYGVDTWGCGKFGGDIRQSPRRGIYLGYLFFLTKLIELLDTVFFVLRKKQEQITFLHVFHHSIVPLFCWIGIKLAPGGPNGFFPLVNSFIHVLMYTYYALSTLGESIKRHLWWKKYLTRLQMIQFVLVMINAGKTFMSKDCKFPLLFAYLQATIATTFFILFAIFYKSAYQPQKHHKQKGNSKEDSDNIQQMDKGSQSKEHTLYGDKFDVKRRAVGGGGCAKAKLV